jgi:hypothetical protein
MTGPPSAPRSPVIQFWMTDRDVVERAGAMLDSAVTVVRARRAHWKTAYAVRLRGPRAVVWMRRLHPHMGTRRRAQIDRALASYGPDPRRLLDEARAMDALRRLAAGESVRAVADRFGTTIWCIYDLRAGRTHAHVPRPGLAGRSLVGHSACFAALFGGRASWGQDAQDSHCLQAQTQAFAAVR